MKRTLFGQAFGHRFSLSWAGVTRCGLWPCQYVRAGRPLPPVLFLILGTRMLCWHLFLTWVAFLDMWARRRDWAKVKWELDGRIKILIAWFRSYDSWLLLLWVQLLGHETKEWYSEGKIKIPNSLKVHSWVFNHVFLMLVVNLINCSFQPHLTTGEETKITKGSSEA